MSTVNLRSSDGEIVTVDVEVAKVSNTIKNLLENVAMEEGETDADLIPLSNVDAQILKKVIQWIVYHKELPTLNPGEDNEKELKNQLEAVESWHHWFLTCDQATLFGLIRAANYLDIEDLLDASTKVVADMIVGRTQDEIRKLFNIKNDFTPEEEDQLKRKFAWC